jgi:uncharacterized C2H2 Zn-finger protein
VSEEESKKKKRKLKIPRPRAGKGMLQCKCGKSFRTVAALQKHADKEHPQK